jgi:hypothetical protein
MLLVVVLEPACGAGFQRGGLLADRRTGCVGAEGALCGDHLWPRSISPPDPARLMVTRNGFCALFETSLVPLCARRPFPRAQHCNRRQAPRSAGATSDRHERGSVCAATFLDTPGCFRMISRGGRWHLSSNGPSARRKPASFRPAVRQPFDRDEADLLCESACAGNPVEPHVTP